MDLQLADEPKQIVAGDAEDAGRLRLAPSILLEGAADEAAFEIADLLFVGTEGSLGSVEAVAHGGGEMPNLDGGSFGHDDGTLHSIFKFTDVARPGLLFEGPKSEAGEAPGLFAKLLALGLEEMLSEEGEGGEPLAQNGAMQA